MCPELAGFVTERDEPGKDAVDETDEVMKALADEGLCEFFRDTEYQFQPVLDAWPIDVEVIQM